MKALPLLLLLVACDVAAAPDPVLEDRRIACALDRAEAFERVCSWEQAGETITLRRPDGGFRRIRAGADGIEAADGAEPAHVAEIEPGLLEISVAGDRYRLPVAAP